MAPARRVTLAPTAESDDAALTEAAMLLPDELDARPVVVGQEVRVGRVAFIVTGTEPAGRVEVSARGTEIVLTPRPVNAERRLVFDVLFLVDRSWSMGRARTDAPAPATLVAPALDAFVRQGGDLVRHAALATFAADAGLATAWAPLAALDLRALAEAEPRGRARLALALDFALSALATGADARNRHAVVLFTDDAGDEPAVAEAAERASRVGVTLHVVDLGEEPSDALRAVARRTRGVYAFMPDGVTLGPVFRTMTQDVDAPFQWHEPDEPALPAKSGKDVHFDVVMRQVDEEETEP